MRSVLCFGDSNTWGKIPGTDSRFPWPQRWTGILDGALSPAARVVEEGLNGRTTMWDDPFMDYRNGRTALPMLLESHFPSDLLVLMLGTNDLKLRFAKDPFVIAEGIGSLIRLNQSSPFKTPHVLIVSPPPISETVHPWNSRTYAGAIETSRKLAGQYQVIASASGCHFFDASAVATADPIDGVHLDGRGHRALAEALLPIIRKILDLDA